MSYALPFDKVHIKDDDIILFDTSLILSLMGFNNDPIILAECKDLIKVIENEGALFAFSVKTREEMQHVLVNKKFQEYDILSQKAIKNKKEKESRRYSQILGQAICEIDQYIDSLANSSSCFLPSFVGNIDDRLIMHAIQLQTRYGLHGISDCEHIAIAQQQNLPYFATTDKDFACVQEPGLTILLDSASYKNAPICKVESKTKP